MSSLRVIIEPLDPARHRRGEFDCGVEPLDRYLKQQARKDMAATVAACFVAVPEDDPGHIVGFYTLSNATILLDTVPPELIKKLKLPRYEQVPATLLGRLAVARSDQGGGFGGKLLVDAVMRAVAHSWEIASFAVVTDAKDEQAAAFYGRYGFLALTGRRLFLPMSQAAAWLSAP